MKTWSAALRTSDWAEGSPSNKTMTLSQVTQPRQCRSALRTTLNVFEWPSQDRTAIETWKWQSTDGSHPTWPSLRGSAEKNGRISPNPGLQSLSSHTQGYNRCKSSSTKYWVNDLNRYVCDFSFSFFNTFYYGVLRGKNEFSIRLKPAVLAGKKSSRSKLADPGHVWMVRTWYTTVIIVWCECVKSVFTRSISFVNARFCVRKHSYFWAQVIFRLDQLGRTRLS